MADRRTQIEDELLVLRSQEGSRQAFEELVRRWQTPLWRYALRLTGREDVAFDLVQDTWLHVARGLLRLDDPGAFRRWVYTIVSRRAADWHRARGRSFLELPDAGPAAEAPAPSEADQRARDAIARLRGPARVLLALRYGEGFDISEIAEILGIPRGTVKSRLHHAREALRRILERTTP